MIQAEETKRRHEFQQFEIEEAERTREEGGIVHWRERDLIKLAVYAWRGQEKDFELAFEFAADRKEMKGQWFTRNIYGKKKHRNSSNKNESLEETKYYTNIIVSL